jgi:SAM-dependent methyltransferase
MKNVRYKLRFPSTSPHSLDQDEAFFYLEEADGSKLIRFHDYHELYERKGLYEQIFYERLKCRSPDKVGEILESAVSKSPDRLSELRVLDLGAGNGVMGEVLSGKGLARLVGVDILEAAHSACERDRPGVYDAYYVTDMTALPGEVREELIAWQFTGMTCIAALGFGDIPTRAFLEGYNLVQPGGWVAFNIKEAFLQEQDESGFAVLVKKLLFSEALEVHHLERYCHRLSIDGAPLYYYAAVGRKKTGIPTAILKASRNRTAQRL